MEEFEGAYEEGGFFNLMFHPQVMGRPSRMRMLERLIQHILGGAAARQSGTTAWAAISSLRRGSVPRRTI